MKTISRRRSSSNKKIIAIVVAGFLLGILLLTPARHIGGVLGMVSIPVRSIISFPPHPFDFFISFWKGRAALEGERDALRASLDTAERDLTTLKASVPDCDINTPARIRSWAPFRRVTSMS